MFGYLSRAFKLSAAISVIGIIGWLVTKTEVCLGLAILALVLNLFWFLGWYAVGRTQKDAGLISYRNLNG